MRAHVVNGVTGGMRGRLTINSSLPSRAVQSIILPKGKQVGVGRNVYSADRSAATNFLTQTKSDDPGPDRFNSEAETKPLGEAKMKRALVLGTAMAIMVAAGAPAFAQFSSALNESEATAKEAKASQQRIDQLDDQTSSMINQYRANLKQLEAANRYNASLNRNLASQQRQIERLRNDITNVAGLQRGMQPLMEDMLATLEDVVNADIPFDLDERRARVDRLKKMMDDSQSSAAQKYRLIIEAYQIENEYGRTIQAYEGSVDDGGQLLTGEFLRVGRISLMFKTPDDSVLKIWDAKAKAWTNLDKSYLPDVRLGLRMAKEQTAPDLLPVPVPAPTKAAAAQ
jgi:hypothetical protein